MNIYDQWIGVTASVVLVITTAAILLRDWKCHDRKTKAYSVFTIFLFVVTLLAACGLGWHTWKTFPEPRRQASFLLFLNNLAVTNGSVVIIPTTNKTQVLRFCVSNTGNDTAERLTVDLYCPSSLTNFNCTGTWPVQAPVAKVQDGKRIEICNWTHYRIEARDILAPNKSTFICDPLQFDQEITQPFTLPLSLFFCSIGTGTTTNIITVVYIPGTGEPFLQK